MSGLWQKNYKVILKNKKTYLEETNQASEADLDMADILELSEQEFNKTVINMIRTLMQKGDNM